MKTLDLFVVKNQAQEQILNTRLDKTKAKAMVVGSALLGYKFENIFVVFSDQVFDSHEWDWINKDLPLKLPPNKEVNFL